MYAADATYPQRTFGDSQTHCQLLGGDLVVINDNMENNIIKTQAYDKTISPIIVNHYHLCNIRQLYNFTIYKELHILFNYEHIF